MIEVFCWCRLGILKGNKRTCGHQDTTLIPISGWAANSEITEKLGTRYVEVNVGLLKRIMDVLRDGFIFFTRVLRTSAHQSSYQVNDQCVSKMFFDGGEITNECGAKATLKPVTEKIMSNS